jgi:very-short-patch-repair endonuclease
MRTRRRDTHKLERAKELRRHMTPEEATLWQRLRTNQLDGQHFRRQVVLDSFIVDFYCATAHLIVELDGSVHDDQAEADAERDAILAASGLRIMRIRNDDVRRDLPGVLARIAAACEAREERTERRPSPSALNGSPGFPLPCTRGRGSGG